MNGQLVEEFRSARRDPQRAVLEGVHAVKHALRFGAALETVVVAHTSDAAQLAERLSADLAPALATAHSVGDDGLARLVPRVPRTGIVAIARRPAIDPHAVLASPAVAPVIVLETPRTMGNLGAVVRVAAAAGAAGVLTTGPHDPWHPDAIRGAAGLQFALPVARFGDPTDDGASVALARAAQVAGRPVLALDPDGDVLEASGLPGRSVLAFGTERDGLTPDLLAAADARLRLPMQAGVSSLNLATSVAATLYVWRLNGAGATQRP